MSIRNVMGALRVSRTGDHIQFFLDGYGRVIRLSQNQHRRDVWPEDIVSGELAPEDPYAKVIHAFIWDESIYGLDGMMKFENVIKRLQGVVAEIGEYIAERKYCTVIPAHSPRGGQWVHWGCGIRFRDLGYAYGSRKSDRSIRIGDGYLHAVCYPDKLKNR